MNPMMRSPGRLGAAGRSGGMAGSSTRNCSSVLALFQALGQLGVLVPLQQGFVPLLDRGVVARQLVELLLALRRGLDARLIPHHRLAQNVFLFLQQSDLVASLAERPLQVRVRILRRRGGRVRAVGAGRLLFEGDDFRLQSNHIGVFVAQVRAELGKFLAAFQERIGRPIRGRRRRGAARGASAC